MDQGISLYPIFSSLPSTQNIIQIKHLPGPQHEFDVVAVLLFHRLHGRLDQHPRRIASVIAQSTTAVWQTWPVHYQQFWIDFWPFATCNIVNAYKSWPLFITISSLPSLLEFADYRVSNSVVTHYTKGWSRIVDFSRLVVRGTLHFLFIYHFEPFDLWQIITRDTVLIHLNNGLGMLPDIMYYISFIVMGAT